MVRYVEIHPIPSLRAFVHRLWILDMAGFAPASNEVVPQRVLPDGRPELVIHFGDLCHRLDPATGRSEPQQRSLMIGASKSHVVLAPGKSAGMIGVRFKSAGAMRFLKSSMSEFSDQIVGLRDWSSRCGAEIENRVLEASQDEERFRIVQDFLVAQLMDGRPDLVLSKMIGEIVKSRGTIDLSKVYADLNISERQAERKFLAGIGLGPKLYARVIRFQAIVQAINQAPRSDLTALALDFGYFDQSHFIREFKSFAGITPRAFVTETHAISDCFTAS